MDWFVVSATAVLFVLVLIVSLVVHETPGSDVAGLHGVRSEIPESFVVFDLETTGLDAGEDEIIEIGAIKITDVKQDVHTFFQALVKPMKPIPKEITRLTGISQEMVDRDGASLEEAVRGFMAFAGELPLVAFNAKFDMAFLRKAARKCDIAVRNPTSCALKKARRAWPDRSSYRLSDLARWAGLSDEDTHRALGDCKRTLILYAAAASKLSAGAPSAPYRGARRRGR